MFFRKKKNNKKENIVSQSAIQKSSFDSEYVEINQLARQFSELSQYAHEINAIGQYENRSNASLFFYQQSIKRAFMDDFENRIEELLGKKISFSQYWNSRSC